MHSETIDNKVEKIDGKGLIDNGFAATNTTIDNLEYADLKLGEKNEIVEGITRKGRKEINIPIDLPTESIDFENNEEWADVTIDSKGRVTKGTRKNGSNYLYELRSESLDRLEAKFHPIIVSKNYPADYSSLSKAIIEATKEFDRVVIVDEGTYDIIQEFKEIYNNSFFDNYTGTYPHGLFLKNRVKLYFSPKANVVCNYTGNNDSVKINFSPFNSGMYGFEIHGLNIHCENVRYCIHDERAQDTDLYYNVYDGCNMYLDNSNNTAWQSKQCIGGGLGANGNIKIQNCIFESVDLVGSIVSYHNCENSNAKSFLAINGNVCRGETTFRLSWYGSSTLITTAIISNNVIGTEIRHQAENASLYDTHNTELIEFNNVLQN